MRETKAFRELQVKMATNQSSLLVPMELSFPVLAIFCTMCVKTSHEKNIRVIRPLASRYKIRRFAPPGIDQYWSQ